jgi:hypothetical protein
VGNDRLRQPLEVKWTKRDEVVGAPTAGEQAHELGSEDLSPVSLRAQPRRFDHLRAVVVAVVAELGVAVAQTDPHRERLLRAAVVTIEGLLHGHGAFQCGADAFEHNHDAVARALDLGAFGGRGRRPQQGVMGLAKLLGCIRAEPRR